MNHRGLPRFRRGEPPRARKFNRLRAAGEALARFVALPPLFLRPSGARRTLDLDLPETIWIRLDGESNPYDWVEVARDGGAWVASPTGRSGTLAVEVRGQGGLDGKVVPARRVGRELLFQFHRKGPPDCHGSLCVAVYCGEYLPGGAGHIAVPGVEVVFREANTVTPHSGAVVATGTTGPDGRVCIEYQAEPGARFDIRAEHDDYHGSGEALDVEAICGVSHEILVVRRRHTQLAVLVYGCAISFDGFFLGPSGALVTVSGDAAASGSTVNGQVTLDLELPDQDEIDLTVALVPPTGKGWSTPDPRVLHLTARQACHLLLTAFTLGPGGDCVCTPQIQGGQPCGRPYPPTLEYSDDLGSTTLFYAGGGVYTGTFSYASSCASVERDPPCPPGTIGASLFSSKCEPGTASVAVNVTVRVQRMLDPYGFLVGHRLIASRMRRHVQVTNCAGLGAQTVWLGTCNPNPLSPGTQYVEQASRDFDCEELPAILFDGSYPSDPYTPLCEVGGSVTASGACGGGGGEL
jgi:hypothetical protein